MARKPEIDARLSEILSGEDPRLKEFAGAMRYSVLGGGKRFRPLLCLAFASAVSEETPAVLDAACAVELVHCFSLVHDDLPCLDDDDLRRGKKTAHLVYGEAVALLAGDALFAKAFEVLSTLATTDERRCAALTELASASGTNGMVGGQVVDITSEGKPTNLETIRWIHSRKTGALITASCSIGAILAGGTVEDISAAAAYGAHIGMAFQIADDVLNETGSQAAIGKRTKTDEQRRKATYPAVMGLERAERMAEDACSAAADIAARFGARADTLVSLAAFSVRRSV